MTDRLVLHDLLWCARRLPRDLKAVMKREGPRVFVAGGFIRSCIANEPVNDIDVFTPTRADAERLAWELANDCMVPVELRVKGQGLHAPYTTDNAFTVTHRRVSVQFIHRWLFDKPEDALESFDFTIAKAALWWHPWETRGEHALEQPGWRSACAETFYPDLAAKRLVYTSPQRNEDAGGSMLRVLKFYQRNYRIPLDSLGAVIARLCQEIEFSRLPGRGFPIARERALAMVITGLLREVDPLVDPDAEGHVDTVSDALTEADSMHTGDREPLGPV
jgi:hypothetical protein